MNSMNENNKINYVNKFNDGLGGGPRIQLNSGHWIPLVGLGTYKIVGQQMVESAVDAALQCGYRHFDTAKLYKNEPELGSKDLFITTKFWAIPAEKAAIEVPRLIDESLANLRTSYIDLLLIHYPKPEESANEDAEGNAVSRRETWLAMEKIDTQKVHSIGVSNYEICHLEEMKNFATKRPAVNQVEFHPHFRRADLKQYCDNEGIHFQAFSPLARQEPALLESPIVLELAEKYKTTVQNVLLSFATSQGVSIVPKSISPTRIKSNFACLDLQLDAEDLQKLNNITVNQHYIRCTPWLVQ